MNIYSVVGFLISAIVVGYSAFLSTDNMLLFWDWPSAFIVVGGSLAATSICFPLNKLGPIFKVFVKRMLMGKQFQYKNVIKELVDVSDLIRRGESLKAYSDKTGDFFLKESLIIIEDGVIQRDELIDLLNERNDNLMYNHMEDVGKIKVMAKFPPAFGMIGTTMGMVVLLASLSGADAMKKIGPAMAVAVITTLYGCLIANLSFVPIAENLAAGAKETYVKNKMIIEGLKMGLVKTNPILMVEKLNSFLTPTDRVNWKDVVGKKA